MKCAEDRNRYVFKQYDQKAHEKIVNILTIRDGYEYK